MRPEPNNDIDLLLRQLSRRNGSPVSEIEEQHLDADELNSYVANALPAAARARYTEHLADCSSCRKMVAQLSAAHGPVPAQQGAGVVASWSLKSFFASLFSPMVLRYAVPALGLVLIAVVGIVVFRQNERRNSIASLTDAQRKTAANQPQPAASASPQFYYDNNTVAKNDTTRAEKEATKAATGPAAQPAKEVPAIAKGTADTTSTAAAEPPPPPAKAAPVEAEEDRPADALKLKKDAPTEKQAAAREANKERDEASKNEPAKAETSTVTVTQGNAARKDIAVRSAKSSETNVARGTNDLKRAPAPATATGGASAGAQPESRSREQQNEQSKPTGTFASTETRSVAGRRFQKRGSVWTDSDYDSSKPITNVARGSEQYRALIGDEPSIREIADQLAGEIIVVWKGRTYRIR